MKRTDPEQRRWRAPSPPRRRRLVSGVRAGPWALALGLAALLTACGEDAAGPGVMGGLEMPEIDGPRSPGWAPDPTREDPAVATVGGVPILLSQLQQAVDADRGATPPEALLERMIEAELLAQAALQRDYYREDVVLPVFRLALVEELLARDFVRPPPATFFSEESLRKYYYHRQIRVRFDHVDLFVVSDAQFGCCTARYDQCDAAQFEACMSEQEPHARELHAILGEERRDLRSFQAIVRDARGRFPRLRVKREEFFYNVNLPHSEQRGHNVVNENFARAAMELKVGEYSGPVRSRNGWHLVFLAEHVPEEHRTLDDPGVRAEIISRTFEGERQVRFLAWLASLHERHRAEKHPEVLDRLFRGMKKSAASPPPP